MQSKDAKVQQAIAEILASQRLAVLSTARDGHPYTSLMAYVHTPDLLKLAVATSTATRKYNNLANESRVSLLVDSRSNSASDFHEAEALTIMGKAVIGQEEDQQLKELYIARHPYLTDFLSSPATALVTIQVKHYLLVSRFQNVMEYHPGDEKDIFS